MTDDLRPRATVEVTCAHDECGWSWWLDALDPLLPDGPFLCADHGGPPAPAGPWPKAQGADHAARRAAILALPADELIELWERLCRLGPHEDARNPEDAPDGTRTG